ncbi:HEAT repeat domain-containing protein [Gloeocapsa sp. PCC 73106]|uniref:HEAT repeat domain-containing protein n=1 Tax=Gloeocapsa sp. PCC 73106 TaxID=102232 RepID=UPI0002ACC9BF|nr:HEAT repeat domain-containing protein [Gloeocapsa sp. PCC 73106]ELR97452.1 HEAT repeat-containing protein [Gloeocapsa sp. PCC 73106]
MLNAQEAETDELLFLVAEQLNTNSFNHDDHSVLRLLVEALGDTRGMTRLRCAQTLQQIGTPAIPFLLEALANHPNVVVRRASGKTLTLLAAPRAIPHLIHALLNDVDTVVKGSAVGALARMGSLAVPPLLEILATPELPESTKGHAAWALAFIGAEAKEHLSAALTSDSAAVRSAVVGAIAQVAQTEPKEELFQILTQSLFDTDTDVRCEAAAALGNLGYQAALPQLLELLQAPDGESRRAAALALMKIGDRSACAPLNLALSQESETSVQSVLKLALAQLEKS